MKCIKEMSKEELLEYHKNKMREWRKKNRERDLELKKKWRDNNKEHRIKYGKEYEKRPEVRGKRREYLRKYAQKYPEKCKQTKDYINNYLKKYLKDSKKHEKYLQRQRDYSKFRKSLLNIYESCQKCSSKENLEIHHLTYNNPTINDLIILCRKCHRQLHRKNQTGGKK